MGSCSGYTLRKLLIELRDDVGNGKVNTQVSFYEYEFLSSCFSNNAQEQFKTKTHFIRFSYTLGATRHSIIASSYHPPPRNFIRTLKVPSKIIKGTVLISFLFPFILCNSKEKLRESQLSLITHSPFSNGIHNPLFPH